MYAATSRGTLCRAHQHSEKPMYQPKGRGPILRVLIQIIQIVRLMLTVRIRKATRARFPAFVVHSRECLIYRRIVAIINRFWKDPVLGRK